MPNPTRLFLIAGLLLVTGGTAAASPEQPVWARCATDAGALACARDAEAHPALTTKILIDVTGADGVSYYGPVLDVGGAGRSSPLPAEAYPLTVRVSALFTWSSAVAAGVLPTAMVGTFTVADPSATLTVAQPFALWRVAVTARATMVKLSLDGPALAIAPFANGYPGEPPGEATLTVGGGLFARDGETAERYVIAPPGGSLAGTATFYDLATRAQTTATFALAGSATLVAENSAITAP